MSLPSAFVASGPLPSATFSGWDSQTEQLALFASATASGNAAGPANAIQYSDGAGNFQGTANGTLSSAGDVGCQTLTTIGTATIGGNAALNANLAVTGTSALAGVTASSVTASGAVTANQVATAALSATAGGMITLPTFSFSIANGANVVLSVLNQYMDSGRCGQLAISVWSNNVSLQQGYYGHWQGSWIPNVAVNAGAGSVNTTFHSTYQGLPITGTLTGGSGAWVQRINVGNTAGVNITAVYVSITIFN